MSDYESDNDKIEYGDMPEEEDDENLSQITDENEKVEDNTKIITDQKDQ